LRDFYQTWRYSKAGTDDFRVAMEKAGGRPLSRFFEEWIYGSDIPRVRFTSTVEGETLSVRFEQTRDVFDVPITVTITYADGQSEDVVVAVTEKVVEKTVTLKGPLRGVDVNKDHGALVEVTK
jgi:aminopeptidase N